METQRIRFQHRYINVAVKKHTAISSRRSLYSQCIFDCSDEMHLMNITAVQQNLFYQMGHDQFTPVCNRICKQYDCTKLFELTNQ